MKDPRVARARALISNLSTASAADLVELAELALGELAVYERRGGDRVGTDAYPLVRDAGAAIAARLASDDVEVRLAAAYVLAFVLESASDVLPSLERALAAEHEDVARAGMRLALARLRASVRSGRGEVPEVPWEGIVLDPRAAGVSVLERAVIALEQVFLLPRFPRKCQPDVADALDAVPAGVRVGPWGGGELRALVQALRATLWVQTPKPETPAVAVTVAPEVDEVGDEGDDEDDDDDGDGDGDEGAIGDQPVDDPYTQRRPKRAPSRVALPGLHDVAWSTLEHAYGPATGVPGMIEALASPDAADRAWAIDSLEACIHHQGSVYPASTAAVPFLIQLAAEAGLEGRAGILVLLCGIATHQPDMVRGARGYRSEAYGAVVAGGPTYLRLLADPEPSVRTAAAYVVSFLEPPPADALAALRAALATEVDRRARASLLLALGYVSRTLASTEDRALLTAYLDDDAPLVRGAAAIALLQLAGAEAPAAARAVLAALPGEIAAVTEFFPWADGYLGGVARTIRLAFQTDDELWATVDAVLAGGGDPADASRAANRLFGKLFYDDVHGHDRPWLPAELDDRRRKLLRFYVQRTPRDKNVTLLPFWEVAGDAGLFTDLANTERLLGEHPGVLDGGVTIAGEERPVWAWIIAANGERTPAADVVAALATLPPAERLAIVDEVFAGTYRLTAARWHVEYGAGDAHPHSPARANDYTSRALLLLADLAGTSLEAVAWAEGRARVELAQGAKRAAATGVVAALVLAREAAARGDVLDPSFDPLLAFDQAPATTYRLALRALLALLPTERVERLVGEVPLYTYQSYIDPRGEVRRWTNGEGWSVLPFASPSVVARTVLAAVREWERHRAAADDRHAEPVRGRTTSSIENKPGDDQPFPRDRAIALLAAAGAAAVTAIDAALADGAITDRELLAEARAAALHAQA